MYSMSKTVIQPPVVPPRRCDRARVGFGTAAREFDSFSSGRQSMQTGVEKQAYQRDSNLTYDTLRLVITDCLLYIVGTIITHTYDVIRHDRARWLNILNSDGILLCDAFFM